ncbi:hypothetical protein TspCOW1_21730 [Thiohalobacter sp. COW1]|uniref:ribbon-helix-helix protein, CopG family n=1 Tax=Thiohalobacter sp. COW1 TaxID=2795687 RepID=UPI0019164E83|nr:ribbon-helix-helix protein, CopG family [Thiohalobacter sp. COW1]BCO32070.1 hypothetical protein TspCOW1_21730 [Thiohalobacter sp. COW1]
MSTESSRKRREELREMGYKASEIWLPKEMYELLDKAAKKNNVTRSKMVEAIISQSLKDDESKHFFFFSFSDDSGNKED